MTVSPIDTNNLQSPQAGGSVYTGSYSSYSGADIKILVNLYGNSQNSSTSAEAVDNLKNLAESESNTARQISSVKTKLQQVHSGTPDESRLGQQLLKLQKDYKSIQDLLAAGSDDTTRSKVKKASPTKVLAEAQTLSYSTHRPKIPVRALGSVSPKGYVRCGRQIAGTIIFTVFNEHVFYELMDAHPSDFDGQTLTTAVLDQLPPVDILISFANEYGAISRMTIRGVEFSDEGQTMSIEDMLTENVVHWVARDWDPMRAVSQRKLDENSRLLAANQMKRASDLILEEDYQKVKNYFDPYSRFAARNNPYR